MSAADQKPVADAKVPPASATESKTLAAAQQPASPATPGKVSTAVVAPQAAKIEKAQATVVATKTESAPIWQFAETNQGLLSLIALVVALIFGLYEYRLNKRAGLVQRREYITMVVGVIDEMLKFTSDVRARFDGGESFQSCAAEWQRKIIAPRFLMDAVRANAPGDPLLAIEANRLWHSLQLSDHMDPAGTYNTRFAEMEANLIASKTAIEARW